MNDYLMIATVLKPQGIRGECKIRSWAADISLFRQWHMLYRKDGGTYIPVSVKVTRIQDEYVYALLDGSVSADEAEHFRSSDLNVDRAHAAPAKDGAVLIADLIGCEAKDKSGNQIGVLTDVLQYGTVDTWVFRIPGGTLMAPALTTVFLQVNPEQKTILVDTDRLEEVAVRS